MERKELAEILLEAERSINRAKDELRLEISKLRNDLRTELKETMKDLRGDLEKMLRDHHSGWSFFQENFVKLAVVFVLVVVVLKTLNIDPALLLELWKGEW